MYVGIAIRMAQALSLGFGDMPEPGDRFRPLRVESPKDKEAVPDTETEVMIEKEVRRRTMFSCLVLDRMLACGKERGLDHPVRGSPDPAAMFRVLL